MDFVVLADKRTGSSFFMECLNSHPDIICYDELFMIRGGLKKRRGQFLFKHLKKKRKYDINQYLNFIYDSGADATGFRLMYPQNDHFKVSPILKKRDVKIIHLIRKNTLKMVISKKTKGVFEPVKMNFDVNQLVNEIKKHKNKEKKQNKLIGKKYKDVITVKYEEMIGKSEGEKGEVKKFGAFNLKSDMITYLNDKTAKKVCEFLGVENISLSCNVTKKNSNNVWNYIENVDEVKNALIENKWGYML